MSTIPLSRQQNESIPKIRKQDRVLVIDERSELLSQVEIALTDGSRSVNAGDVVTAEDVLAFAEKLREQADLSVGTIVFSPLRTKQRTRVPDVDYAWSVIQACKNLGIRRFVLISSAEVYGAQYSNSGLLPEKEVVARKRSNRTAERWAEIEDIAARAFHDGIEMVILRPCWSLWNDQADRVSRFFNARVAFPITGFDTSIQLLSVDDLAGAIVAAVNGSTSGIYNVAPDEVIPIRAALRMAKSMTIPVPFTILRGLSSARSREQLDFMRYSWTVSGQKLRDELGFRPQHSSAETLVKFIAGSGRRSGSESTAIPNLPYDQYGMDEAYIRSCGRWQLGFMDKVYWRIDVQGLENIPADGGGVLAGPHRGFMPFDGVMIIHMLLKHIGRVPRFLMHPALVKFPFLGTFLTRIGGIIATQENADRVLKDGEIVGVFPEGIRGAFRMYNRGETYRLGKFRDDYVKVALRHGVPIIPFVAVGPAETFPILKKIEWPWWKKLTHWPFFPITATWPLLPVPLPTKWHIKFLEPIDTSDYHADAADDRKVVSRLSGQIREAMQTEIDTMLSRRRSVFYGSIFKRRSTHDESTATPSVIGPDSEDRVSRTMDVA